MWLISCALVLAADFTGSWKLDGEASDPLDPILVASGASWIERQAAGAITVTQVITQSPDRIVLAIDSSLVDRVEELVPDGVERDAPAKHGTSRTRCTWDGDALVTVSRIPDAAGATFVMTATRTLEDGGKTMRQRLEVTRPDGTKVAADRIYRRL